MPLSAPRRKIVTCRALAHVLQTLAGPDAPLTILDIGLHLRPERLREQLQITVAELEEDDSTILLGYGLCGRALEGVVSRRGTLVLPRVDDCVGVLLGSRARHRQVLAQRPGCYFLESQWLDTELNIFAQMDKGLDRMPAQRRKELIKAALKHYQALAMLGCGNGETEAAERCQALADQYDLEFIRLEKDLGLLGRLLAGAWSADEFVVAPPGQAIPLF